MSGAGGMSIVQITGHLNSQKYLDILENTMVPTANQYLADEFVFQHDRSSIHTSHLLRDYLEQSKIWCFNWPSKGADMNPIENVWAEMERELSKLHTAKNADELWQNIQTAWNALRSKPTYWLNLVDSMPNRMQAVVNVKGDWTRY